jgi:hypothetical protein
MKLRFRYRAPEPKRNITAQQAFRLQVRPDYPLVRARYTSMRSWRYDRDLYRPQFPRRDIRMTLGFIRAFGSTHFFNGSNRGAEND